MKFVFTHAKKNDALGVIKAFLQMVRTRYDQIVRFFRMNDEQTLDGEFDAFIKMYGILQKRTAFYTADQNGKTKRSEEVLTIRAKAMRIANQFSTDMWPKIYKTVRYFSNRTSRKNLKWKTSHKALFNQKSSLSHLHSIDCRAYSLRPKISKKNKLDFCAMIDYLVDYDSINIFRI